MKKGFSPEHGCELVSKSLEHMLNGGRVSKESHGHLQALVRDIANSSLKIVGDPFNKGRGVPIHDVQLLFTYF